VRGRMERLAKRHLANDNGKSHCSVMPMQTSQNLAPQSERAARSRAITQEIVFKVTRRPSCLSTCIVRFERHATATDRVIVVDNLALSAGMKPSRLFPKSSVVGFDAPPSIAAAVSLTSSTSSSSHQGSSTTARSLLTQELKASSQGSSSGSHSMLQAAVEYDGDYDSQSDCSSSCDDECGGAAGDLAEDESMIEDDFAVRASDPIAINVTESMKLLANFWVSQRPVTNKRLLEPACRG
jgi:hypothetical protein